MKIYQHHIRKRILTQKIEFKQRDFNPERILCYLGLKDLHINILLFKVDGFAYLHTTSIHVI